MIGSVWLGTILARLPVLVSSSEDSDSLILLVIGFAIGLYLVYDGFDKWQTKRLVEDTPTEKVRSIAMGRTELEGVARNAGETIEAPFTDQQCLHVAWEIEEYKRSGDDDKSWQTVASDQSSLAFYLEDDTGRVLVRADTGDPEYEISDDNETTITVGSGRTPPDEVVAFFERYNRDRVEDASGFFENPLESMTDLFTNGTIQDSHHRRRYTQTILPDGAETYVLGSAVERENGQGDTNEELIEITRQPDLDVFLVSDRSEEELESHYERWGPIEIVGGLAVSAGCLYLFLNWFGL